MRLLGGLSNSFTQLKNSFFCFNLSLFLFRAIPWLVLRNPFVKYLFEHVRKFQKKKTACLTNGKTHSGHILFENQCQWISLLEQWLCCKTWPESEIMQGKLVTAFTKLSTPYNHSVSRSFVIVFQQLVLFSRTSAKVL